MMPTTGQGWLWLALAALIVGFCGAGGVWLFHRLTRRP
jgi:LPXTG-motif cell wall-anchored protein